VAELAPDLDADEQIAAGFALVNGVPRTSPASVVQPTDTVTIREPKTYRGMIKLSAALDEFGIDVDGRVALDAGASVGGFVTTLLERGARRVYAVEVGYGQLLGSLRQDPRVVNLERTNVGDLSRELVPDAIGAISLDLGYLALAIGVPQLNAIDIAPDADLVALVKPTAELGLQTPPEDEASLAEALERACRGIAAAGWDVVATMDSPIRGGNGAIEMLVHARRA
jgi:23S rRNA (cytidine1920-2'-O)/16S rRNA (cytidine1409-2'-O)-methyltransferase